MSDLLNQGELAKALGVDQGTISNLTEQGAIIPEIWEGKLYRYDLAKVREQLAERARQKAELAREKAERG